MKANNGRMNYKKQMNEEGVTTQGCKANLMHKIDRRTCRNNCKNWESTGKKKGICKLGLG